LPPVVLLHWAVAWKPWMGPYISSVHTVLTQEGHLEFAVEVGPLVSKEAPDDVETMLVPATGLSRAPVKPLGGEKIE